MALNPLTREPLRLEDLVPNESLKEKIVAYVKALADADCYEEWERR